jgi:sec-independent protein translocase protein TatA
MFGLGFGEIAVILFIALIFIGPKKLPELARGLGKGIREFQNAARGLQETIKNPPASNSTSQDTSRSNTLRVTLLEQSETKSSILVCTCFEN